MNLIRPSYEIIEQGPGLQGIYDIIENAGKTSYKSEVKGGETAKRFVEARSKEGHGAVLEFGTVYLKIEVLNWLKINKVYSWDDSDTIIFYKGNKYSKVTEDRVYCYITTNYRVLVENNRLDDLKYLCEPTKYHEKRYCVRFNVDRFTGEEFLRHRVFSFCRESSRYCNYSKEKFGGNITYIIPSWIKSGQLAEGENITWWDGDWVDMDKMKIVCFGHEDENADVNAWLNSLSACEDAYKHLTGSYEWQAQQARTILPCAIKSPLAMCGFASDWIHFFNLRAIGITGAPHPQAKELAEPLMKEFLDRKYITEEDFNNDALALYEAAHNWGRPKKQKKND